MYRFYRDIFPLPGHGIAAEHGPEQPCRHGSAVIVTGQSIGLVGEIAVADVRHALAAEIGSANVAI